MLKPPSGREIVMSKCPRCDAIGEMNRDDSYPPGTIWEPLSAGGGIHVPDREPCLRRQLALALEENKRLREVVEWLKNAEIAEEAWEADEGILTLNGKPIGSTIPRGSSMVSSWWPSVKRECLAAAASKPDGGE